MARIEPILYNIKIGGKIIKPKKGRDYQKIPLGYVNGRPIK